jgi:protein TonB
MKVAGFPHTLSALCVSLPARKIPMPHAHLNSGAKPMSRRTNAIVLFLLLLSIFCVSSVAQSPLLKASGSESDRDRDGLAGPVRRIRTETAKLSTRVGKMVEGQHQLLETVAYGIKGNKMENAYYPVSGSALTGKEVYKYDEKGNISEMTLLNSDGSLLSKESYTYEYDFVGNWTKMTTSVAIVENGKLIFEPTEVTYRAISYYLDEATLAKMSQAAPASPAAVTPATDPSVKPDAQLNVKPAAVMNAPSVNQPAKAKSTVVVPPPASSSALDKSGMAAAQNTIASVSPMVGPVNNNAKSDIEPPITPAMSAPSPKPLLRPISGGVLNGSAISLPKPLYPEQAKTVRASGIVAVEVVIDTNGKVISARAVSGHPMLQQAAVQAANQARFSPTTLSGQPVKVTGTINYNFALVK